MRILTFLLLMVVGTGQMWAQDEPEPVQFGTVMYNGTAANDGGSLKFFTSSKDAKNGENAITLTNGQSTGPTGLTDIMVKNGEDWESVGTGFFIMATPAVGHRLPNTEVGATVDFIQAEVVTSAQQAPSRRNAPDPTIEVGQTLPVKFYGYYFGEGGSSDPATEYYGLYYVVMPADVNLSVSITAMFPVQPMNDEEISYVDADGETKSKAAGEVYVLDGTEARLGYGSYNNRTEHETWYVLPDDLTYTNGLELYGKVHLILADVKTMSYDGTERFISGFGALDIYGQGGETEGAISAKTTAQECIFFAGDVTINGGNVSAESTDETTNSDGIHVEKTLTINGGTVSGKSNGDGILGLTFIIHDGNVSGIGTTRAGIIAGTTSTITITGGHVRGDGGRNGIYCDGGIIISGGQVEANGGTGEDCAGLNCGLGDIILGWTTPTDYIKASSYRCGTNGKAVKTATGQRLVAFNAATGTAATTIVSGTVDDVSTLAGKTLRPLDGNYVSINTADFTFSGTTSTTSPFTITTGEGETATTTHYYIYKKDDNVTLTYTGSGFVQVTGATLAAVEGQPMQRTFTMPATDVALTATAVTGLTATSVAYDGTARTPVIKQGDDVFAPANYAIAYQLGDEAVTAAEVKNANTYICTLTGVGQYIGTNTVPFDITLRSTSLAVEIVNPETTVDGHPILISDDDAHVKVTLVPVNEENETTELPAINGIVTLSVSDGINEPKPYTVAIVNGVGHFYVSNMLPRLYDFTASFDGDANHAASTSETTLEVCMILTETTSSLDKTEINVGESVTVTAKINEVGLQRPVIDNETHTKKTIMFETKQPLSIDAIVTVKCKTPWDNGEGISKNFNNYITAIVNGQGIKTFSHLPAGPRTVNVVFAGNDRHKGSASIVENLQVNKTETTISIGTNSPVIAKEQNYE
jgi:hypothetical protein